MSYSFFGYLNDDYDVLCVKPAYDVKTIVFVWKCMYVNHIVLKMFVGIIAVNPHETSLVH